MDDGVPFEKAVELWFNHWASVHGDGRCFIYPSHNGLVQYNVDPGEAAGESQGVELSNVVGDSESSFIFNGGNGELSHCLRFSDDWNEDSESTSRDGV